MRDSPHIIRFSGRNTGRRNTVDTQLRKYSVLSGNRIDTMPSEGGTMANLAGIVQLLKKEQSRLTNELKGISAALAAFGKTYGKQTGNRGRLSAAARARIAAAQRARWARVKASKSQSPNASAAPKRAISAAARKRMAVAQRARWAKERAEKKG